MSKSVGRPLTWLEYCSLQGVLTMIVQANRERNRLERVAGELLAPGVTSPHYDGEDLVEYAGEQISEASYMHDDLGSVLRRLDVQVEPAPEPAAR